MEKSVVDNDPQDHSAERAKSNSSFEIDIDLDRGKYDVEAE